MRSVTKQLLLATLLVNAGLPSISLAGVDKIKLNSVQTRQTPNIPTTFSGESTDSIESSSISEKNENIKSEIAITKSNTDSNSSQISTNTHQIGVATTNTSGITITQQDHFSRLTGLESRIPVQYRCSSGSLSGNKCYVDEVQCKYDHYHVAKVVVRNSSNCSGSNYYLWDGKPVWSEDITLGDYISRSIIGTCKGQITTDTHQICKNVSSTHDAIAYCPSGYTLTSSRKYCTR